MRRATLNFIIDAIALLSLLCLAGTGGVLKSVLPPGSGGGGYGRGYRGGRGPVEVRDWLGLVRHQWGDIHFVLAVIFIALILVHLVLHWSWIKGYIKSIFRPAACPPPGGTGQPAGE